MRICRNPVCSEETENLYCSRACQTEHYNEKRRKNPRSDGRQTLTVRVDPVLFDQLQKAADDRDVSINWLCNRLLIEGFDRMVPLGEWSLTHDD